jgi:WD40 repeat protein
MCVYYDSPALIKLVYVYISNSSLLQLITTYVVNDFITQQYTIMNNNARKVAPMLLYRDNHCVKVSHPPSREFITVPTASNMKIINGQLYKHDPDYPDETGQNLSIYQTCFIGPSHIVYIWGYDGVEDNQPFRSCITTPKGQHVLFGDYDGCLHLYDSSLINNKKQLVKLNEFKIEEHSEIRQVTYENDFVWCRTQCEIYLLEFSSLRLIKRKVLTNYVDGECPYASSVKGDFFVIGTVDSQKTYVLHSKTLETLLCFDGHSKWITSLLFLDSNLILSAGYDKKIILWDVRDGKIHKSIGVESPHGRTFSAEELIELGLLPNYRDFEVHSMAISPDLSLLVAGVGWGSIALIALPELEVKSVISLHDAKVISISFSPFSPYLLCCDEDTAIQFYEFC